MTAMPPPFLSIVTISFNQAPFLETCVSSVLAQTGEDVEYIVVDPGSTDGSREILARYRYGIDRLILEPDSGPADGLNKGFSHARGAYLYFLNSDDFLLPGAVSRMRQCLKSAGEPDILLGGAWMVNGHGDPLGIARPVGTDAKALVGGHGTMVQQGMVFRRSTFDAAGGFNAANRTCWDLELLLAMLAGAPTVRLTDRRFAAFRLHDGGLSGGAGGASHAARYRGDLDRLALEHGLGGAEGNRNSGRWLKAATKALRHPSWLAKRLTDRVVPGRLERLWGQDTRLLNP